MKPTTQVLTAVKKVEENYARLMMIWQELSTQNLPKLNKQLEAAKLRTIVLE